MQSDTHERARFLVRDMRIGGIAEADELWLLDHVKNCADCDRYAETTAAMLRELRSLSFPIDPGMNQRVRDALATRARQRTPDRATTPKVLLAAAILILVAVPSVYRILNDRRQDARATTEDQVLLESIAANVSRGVPEALEPLRQAGEAR